jgi:hypothetical protein
LKWFKEINPHKKKNGRISRNPKRGAIQTGTGGP